METQRVCGFFALAIVLVLCISNGETSSLKREKRDSELVVTTLMEKPYITKKKEPATRNEDYEGFIPDLLKKIGEQLKITYRIEEIGDGKYGMMDDARRTWNGMIGEVKNNRADLAAAPITITPTRKEVVDFTTPFMTFGTVILLRKPANNSATPPPKTVRDLLDQTNLRYGVMIDGSTEHQIRGSSDPDIASLKERLDQINTQEQGVNRVRNAQGKFAFVLEEYTANYWKRQAPCDLTTLPVTQFEKKEYGMVLRKGSPYTKKISDVLDAMKASGEMEELKNKWWSGPCSAGSRSIPATLTLASALGALAFFIRF